MYDDSSFMYYGDVVITSPTTSDASTKDSSIEYIENIDHSFIFLNDISSSSSLFKEIGMTMITISQAYK